jgi:hypothetical protein
MKLPAYLPPQPSVGQLWQAFTHGTRETPMGPGPRDFFYAGVVYAMAALLATMYDKQCTQEDLAAYTLKLEAELQEWIETMSEP